MSLNLRGITGAYNGLASKIKFIKDCYMRSLKDPRVRRFAEEAAGKGSREEQVANLFKGLKKIMVYLPDPVGVEYTKSPSAMLDQWSSSPNHTVSGDCDDMSCMAYSMLKSIGVPAALRVTWFGPGRQPKHIYVIARLQSGDICFDLASKRPFGFEHPFTRKMDFL